ncbi:hypothetical protein G6F17_000623 [Rhizopus arrhizus]|nr:hypothetical protein G6F23_004125 [Rhizopus arrhizus]KAG0759802.1 hypothetical protein G6F24_008803 [Rhizopus arrhizus]KAG0786542.1 hypothetical protein G6F21_008523 [Rhizopus arrhizus]KAG0800259.1 hypothetical protein G6F22_002411 [Rhizopus arrhizus]KAG0860872.1 hypothetical protein G6F17_000623 [Rhizopus arrhizus]
MPHKEMIPSTMIDDKLKQKLSSWKDKIFQPTTGKRKGFDLDTLLTPPQHPFLSPNLSNLSLNKTKKKDMGLASKPTDPSNMMKKIKEEVYDDSNAMEKALNLKKVIKKPYKTNSQESHAIVVKSKKLPSHELSEALFKKKALEIRELPKLEFDNTIELLADSCRRKATEKEKAYMKVCEEVEELKRRLKEEQYRLEGCERKGQITENLIQASLIRYNQIQSKLEKVTVRMDTFKCIFNSLEELLKQIEEARNIQETSNEKLREACLLNIERDRARTKKMNELRQRLQQLAEKNSLWVNQGLQNMTTSRLVIQQQVSSLNSLMNEHRQQLTNVKDSLQDQKLTFHDMVANANGVSQVLQAHTSSLSNKSTLVQHIKSAVNVQQSSLKKILESIRDIETMAGDFNDNVAVDEISKDDKELIKRLQEYNEKTSEDLLQERNRYQIEREEWSREQKRLINQISVLNYKDRLYKQKFESDVHHSRQALETHDHDVITKHTAMAQQENEGPKRTTVTRRMRKQMNERNMNVIYYSFMFQPVNPNSDDTRRRHPLSQNVSASKKTVGNANPSRGRARGAKAPVMNVTREMMDELALEDQEKPLQKKRRKLNEPEQASEKKVTKELNDAM